MGHAVELLFDPTTEAALKGLWARLETAGVPSLASRTHRRHRPHLSLTVAERIDAAPAPGRTGLPGHHAPGRDALRTRGLSSPWRALPQRDPTLALLRLHEQVHAALRDGMVAPRDGYAVGAWMPHCTLAQDLTRAQLVRGIDVLYDQPVIAAHVSSAGLLDTITGEVLPVATLRFHQ